MMSKLLKLLSRKSDQNLRNLQGKYLRRSYVIVKPFFAINSNFTYDSETYDLMKLYIQSPLSNLVELFFAEMVNVLKPLVIFAGELCRGCLTGF